MSQSCEPKARQPQATKQSQAVLRMITFDIYLRQ
jgi:hypothetical protein